MNRVNIQVFFKKDNMKIKIDSDILSASIKSMMRLVQAQTASFEIKKGQMYVTGTGNGNSCMLTIPCEIENKKGTASFSIDANVFLTAIAKRKMLDMVITDSSVTVTSGRYSVELLTHQFEALEVVPEEVRKDKALKIKDKFVKALTGILPKVELKPLLSMTDYVPLGINATDEGTFVACFDAFQSAFFFDKDLVGKLDLMMPSNIFTAISKEIKDQDYSLAITDTTIYAFNDMFEVAMARPQEEGEQITLENVRSLYADLKKRKTDFTVLLLKAEGLRSVLENANAIYEKDATFTFKTKGNKCQLHLKSSYGEVKGQILLDEVPKSDIEFTCDFKFFSTLLEKAPGTIQLRVSKEVLLFTNKPVTYLLSLI